MAEDSFFSTVTSPWREREREREREGGREGGREVSKGE